MLLAVIVGFFLVSCALGFALGWYVRGAYVRRYMKRQMRREGAVLSRDRT